MISSWYEHGNFPYYCPFVRGIHWWPVDSSHWGTVIQESISKSWCHYVQKLQSCRGQGDLKLLLYPYWCCVLNLMSFLVNREKHWKKMTSSWNFVFRIAKGTLFTKMMRLLVNPGKYQKKMSFSLVANNFTMCHRYCHWQWSDMDDLVQDCSNSIANALELPQAWAKPSIFFLNLVLLNLF